MTPHDKSPLSHLGLISDKVNEAWSNLQPAKQNTIMSSLKVLASQSLLNDDIALLLIRHPYHAQWVAALLQQLHTMGVNIPEHLDRIDSQVSVAHRLQDLLKKIASFGLPMNSECISYTLGLQEIEAFETLIVLFNSKNLLDETRFQRLLRKENYPFHAYLTCINLLFKWHLFNNVNEELLSTVSPMHLNELASSLSTLDSNCRLSQKLLVALVGQQKHAEAIAKSLELLQSRVGRFEEKRALIAINGAEAAQSIAGSLSFLILSHMDSDENCAALLNSKPYTLPIEIILYQLMRHPGALTQDKINLLIPSASLLMEPTIMQQLRVIPQFSPLPLEIITALLSKLSTASPTTLMEDKETFLQTCANLIAQDPVKNDSSSSDPTPFRFS